MNNIDNQKQKADDFLSMHHTSEILILPNVWDAASTKIFEIEKFKALGTTSAGICSVLGYADGQKMDFDDSLFLLERIIRTTHLPVSIDIEGGYSNSVEGVVETANKVLAIGGVGINLEDSKGDCSGNPSNQLYDIQSQCFKISAIREMAQKKKIHLFINARTDIFLVSNEDTKSKIENTVERANAYIKTGADSVFVPDIGDFNKDIIQSLVREINGPVNIIAGANTPKIHELEKIGVSRVSFGPRAMRASFDLIRSIAKEIKNDGTYVKMSDVEIGYSEVNQWFEDK